MNGTYDGAPNHTEAVAGTETFHDSSLRQGQDVAHKPVAFARCGAGNIYLIPMDLIHDFIELDKAVGESQGSLESKRNFGAKFDEYKVEHLNQTQLYIKA